MAEGVRVSASASASASASVSVRETESESVSEEVRVSARGFYGDNKRNGDTVHGS